MKIIIVKVFLLASILPYCTACLSSSEFVSYQWKYLNFTWPSSQDHDEAIRNHSYIPENNIITGIKVWKDRMYLSLPRWKKGVPATLVSLPISNGYDYKKDPLLEPFPNWGMQKLDDCSAFQFVQSMEIDPLGRMWVLENGRTEWMSPSPRIKCPARLVILDLEDNNRVLVDYTFPKNVVHTNSVFINDIVLDHEDGGFAYISDTDTEFPGIIVFSLENRSSWKVTHPTMEADKDASSFIVNGSSVTILGAVDGIALSQASTEGNRVVYYSPLSGYNLYSLPVYQLKTNTLEDVALVSTKTSQTDGMFLSNTGYLYYGLMNQDTVAIWNTDLSFEEHICFQDRTINQWPDTFGMDENGYLYWTTNRLQRFMSDQLNIQEINYRIVVIKTISKSYQYYEDGSTPEIPLIS